MGEVKCPQCGLTWPATKTMCDADATLLLGLQINVMPPTEVLPAVSPVEPAPAPAAPQIAAGLCDTCFQPQTSCLCGRPVGPRLHLPNGTSVELPVGVEVIIGREADDPVITAALGVHDHVSRRHVSVRVSDGTVQLRDLNSANHTYVEGRELGTAPVERTLPVRLRLGSNIHLEVR